MFILTQNRAGIVDSNKCFGIHVVDDTSIIRAYSIRTSEWMRLGKYDTRERAVEVIQGINVALCENRVSFDMPED